MTEPERILVGAHFRRHFGGPGHLLVSPGRLELTKRDRSVVHAGAVVRLERKRWEPPGTNHWFTLSDGTTTGWATASRSRAERIVTALEGCGFTVERS